MHKFLISAGFRKCSIKQSLMGNFIREMIFNSQVANGTNYTQNALKIEIGKKAKAIKLEFS